MDHLPTGIVTFVFTDIEGSTKLLQQAGTGYRPILEQHGEIIRTAVEDHRGTVVSTEGDSYFAVFSDPADALAAVTSFQLGLAAHQWPEGVNVRVRVGIHTGQGTLGGDNYFGLDVHRAARIGAAGHGGQVLVSQPTALLVDQRLPPDTFLRSLGEHRLKDLAGRETLYQLMTPGGQAEFPPLRTLDSAPNNLPVQLTSFVKRSEVDSITALLRSSRLVTLTGPGGTGKTRLSMQIAAEALAGFPDGVWFVPLAAITDPALVTTAVAGVLGLQPSNQDPDQSLGEYLRGKEMLLVLDNLEQVLAAAPRISTWLQVAPGVKVIATSRAPLHIYGEQEFPVPALSVPGEDDLIHPEHLQSFASVALFVERARAARPDFALDARSAPLVAEIVARLDGLPLAIELAAARARTLSLQAIRDRLGSSLGLLTGGPRDLPERQQTLRNAIQWSFDLLDRETARLFERLGVFVGGMGLSQAEEVCAPGLAIDVLDGVTALIDQSLLRPVPDAVADTRFFMLETIREFAAERLHNSPEAGEIAERHAHSYLALAETAGPEFTKPNQRHWLDRAEADIDNLRAALTMAVDAGRGAIAQRMAGSLWRFWQMRGYLNEGRSRAEAALATPGGDDRSLLQAHDAAAGLAYWQGDMPAALDHYRESLQLARRIGDPAVIAMSLYNFSIPTGLLIGRKEAFEALDEGLALAEQVGDRKLIGLLWWGLGNAYFVFGFGDTELSPGDAESALARYARAAEFLDGTDAIYHIGWNERMLGNVLLHLKRPEEALPHLQKSLDIFVDAGDLSALPLHVADFSTLAVLKGDYERALILAGATHALQAVSETRLLEIIQDLGEMNNAIAAVGAEQAEKLLRDGQNLSVDQVLEMIRGS